VVLSAFHVTGSQVCQVGGLLFYVIAVTDSTGDKPSFYNKHLVHHIAPGETWSKYHSWAVVVPADEMRRRFGANAVDEPNLVRSQKSFRVVTKIVHATT
jgi:hypothetical protein